MGFVKHAVSSVGHAVGGLLGGGSSSSGSSSSSSQPWEPAQGQLKDVLSQAQQQFNKTGGINQQFEQKNVADLTPELQNAVNYGQVTGTDATGRLNKMAESVYGGDLVNKQIAQAQQAASENLQGALQSINQGASATGNMGSSRAGVASGVATGEAQKQLLNNITNIQQQARTEAYGLAQNQEQADMANLMASGGVTQTQAQNKLDTDWYNRVGQQNQGWENLGKYSDIVSGIGSQGGTSSTSGPKQSTFNKVLGMASTVGGIASMFSDASLKTNVKKVGTDQDGNARYTWDWNEEAAKLGLKGKGEGVLAQDIAKTKPEAVNRDNASGKLKVDYAQVGGKSPKGKATGRAKGALYV